MLGVSVFASASLLCGLTPEGDLAEAWMITFRVIQGAGAAFMIPASFAIVVGAFDVSTRGRALAAFFGIQSGLFYATAAWLPSIVGARADAGRAEGGYALTLYFLFGILGSMTLPLIVRWVGSYRRASAIPGAFWVVAYLGLIAAPGAWAVWSTLAGIGQGIGIGLCLTLVAVRPIDAVHGRGVSSMVQSAAYTIAAAAPVVFGWLFDASGGWLAGCILGVGLAVAQTIAGFPASSAKPIGAPREPVGGR